jgi:hypothetical protein
VDRPENPAFLVPVQALSVIFRAKVCAGLRRAGLLDQVAPSTWTTPWVVPAQPAGRGQRVLDYLGRYVFRIAIANSRLEEMTDDDVTFRYQDNRTHETRRVTLLGVEFLQRFLQHVLPRGCAKVRYYGLWSAAHRAARTRARALLTAVALLATPPAPEPTRASCPRRRPPAVSALSRGHPDHHRRAPTVVDAATMTTLLTHRSAPCLHTPVGREGRRVADHPCPHVPRTVERPRRRSYPRPPHRRTSGDRPRRRLTAPVSLADTR